MNSITFLALGLLVLCTVLAHPARGGDAWHPVEGRIMTRWAKEVDPGRALPEYPRPQMVRKEWINLNGLWDYAITPIGSTPTERFAGKGSVPIQIESSLSGVGKPVRPGEVLWYHLRLPAPANATDERLLLHFGAVDHACEVFINDNSVRRHEGGYDPFTIDITDAMDRVRENHLVVAVTDPTDTGSQPRGKQVLDPQGIWYTAVTGIWQTVWLETVPQVSIDSLKIATDPENSKLSASVSIHGAGAGSHNISLIASSNGQVVAQGPGTELMIPNVRTWSPDDPFLYDLRVRLSDGNGKLLDEVTSYFAFRDVQVKQDDRGVARIHLNGKPIFMVGPLDQGWWPDGLYTAPTDDALRFDVESMKRMGFNMCRKHIKVEPARWY